MKKLKQLPILLIVCLLTSCSGNDDSWHLNSMNIDKLWEYAKGGSQTIAFIDTGISEELSGYLGERIVFQYNVIDDTNTVTDNHGHGTEMVSIACGDGYKGVYGVAPDAKIIIIKAVSDDGKTNNDYLLEALKYASEHNAAIVNISLGGHKSDDAVMEQIEKMIADNITIVAAGGDYGNKDLLFPANQDGVISVEAKSEDNSLWELSNTSDNSVLRFPGGSISVLTVTDGNLAADSANGTSQAAAIASGYIALLKDHYHNKSEPLSNEELIHLLEELDSKAIKETEYLLPFKS